MASPASLKKSPTSRESSEPVTIALGALAWAVSEPARAMDPALLAAVIAYLEAYEPDLIGCAETLGIKPSDLVAAGRALA